MSYWSNKVANRNVPPPAMRQQSNLQMPQAGPVITPPPNASPFQAQSNLYPNFPGVQAPGQGGLLQSALIQQVGEIFVKPAMGKMKESLVDLKSDDDGFTYITMKIPTKEIETDPYLKTLLK